MPGWFLLLGWVVLVGEINFRTVKGPPPKDLRLIDPVATRYPGKSSLLNVLALGRVYFLGIVGIHKKFRAWFWSNPRRIHGLGKLDWDQSRFGLTS